MKLFCGDRHWLALVLPASGVIHPLLHCVHCRLPPDEEKKPWAQMVQTVAPSTPLAQPALQGWQVVLPRELEKEPAGHCCCDVEPTEVVKEPEEAGVHAEEPRAVAKDPAGHCRQKSESRCGEYQPSLHCWQPNFLFLMKLPAGQGCTVGC